MTVRVKICGLRDAASIAAAIEGGAQYVGFVFYPQSPRAIGTKEAANLVALLPTTIMSVGLFVNPSDEELLTVLRTVPLQMIQLHGSEPLERVVAIKSLSGLPVIKAIGIADMSDIKVAQSYEDAVDYLLLDAKPSQSGLPGGNATKFDWSVLRGLTFKAPWMLAGGVTESNMVEAVAMTGARILDVSSGVEDSPGSKNPQKIKAFLAKSHQIETCC